MKYIYKGVCRSQPGVQVYAVEGARMGDLSDYVVIYAVPARNARNRQMSVRRHRSQTQRPEEDKIILAIQEADSRKSFVIKTIRDVAGHLDTQQRQMNIAKTSFASGGIAGSILAVLGLALVPVSAGISLGLTAAGIAMGVASGTGGIATEIADKVINSKSLKKAQAEIDKHNRETSDLLQLMDSMQELSGERKFQKFLEERLKSISPRIYEFLQKHMRNEIGRKNCDPEPAKAGVRVAAAAGKIASEVLEAGSKAIKFGSLICSVFTVPLDLHTIVSNSIKIHKKTPSETAEQIRRLAHKLESEGQLDEKEELKRKAEKLERETKRQLQKWMESMTKIGQDVAMKMEELAVKHDFLKKQALVIQIFSICTHVTVRCFFLYTLANIFTSDPASWVRWGTSVSLFYDGCYLFLTIGWEAYTYWVVCQSYKEIEKGLYGARSVFQTAPTNILSSVEERSRSLNSLSKPELKDGSLYHNIFELSLITFKSLLNVSILYSFSAMNDPFEQYDYPSVLWNISSWFVIFPFSESFGRSDLIIFWLSVCVYLFTSSVNELKEDGMSLLARDIINLGEHFQKNLKELIGESCTDTIYARSIDDGLTNNIGSLCFAI